MHACVCVYIYMYVAKYTRTEDLTFIREEESGEGETISARFPVSIKSTSG